MSTQTTVDLRMAGVGPDVNWKSPHPTRDESPEDVFSKRLTQAEALSKVLVCEDFLTFNESIQNNTLWLLSDLLTEVRIAAEEVRVINQAKLKARP